MTDANPMSFLPFTQPCIDEDTIRGVAEVLRGGWMASGPQVLRFEAALGEYLHDRPVRVMTSATAALEIALRVAGVDKGSQVILPAMSFAATANVIARVGAKPVFVDVDLHTRNIDLDQVERAITPATRALLPVHFAGLAVDMDRLYDIAHSNRLRVVEDAAHAIGSQWRGRRIGSFGDLVLQLSSEQEHHHHRRRSHLGTRARGAGGNRAPPLPWHQQRRWRFHGRGVPGRQSQHVRCFRAARPRATAAP
jgi:dTDP-4-amino-4,6-dideoxygalactose transaminase